jgi:hypothetical protein
MPKGKYRLHATKVDRIAIVDRPAVPNAEILLFKRKDGSKEEFNLEKVMETILEKSQFADTFIYGATNGVCDALEQSLWYNLMNNSADKALMGKGIEDLFAEFSSAVAQLIKLAKVVEATLDKQDVPTVAYPTADEMLLQFRQYVASVTIQNAFQNFRNCLGFLVTESMEMPEAEKAIGLLTAELKSIIIQGLETIIPKMLKEENPVELLKVGRKISSARLSKLKEALLTLKEIIKEQEGEVSNEKGDAMTIEQIGKAVETLTAQLAEITAQLAKIEEGKALKADKADVEKSIADLKVEVETLKQAVGSASEALKPITDGVAPLNEKMEKFVKDLEGLTAIVDSVKKMQDSLNKGIETIGKRFGVKTSVDLEKGAEGEGEGKDVFADALKGKK